MSNKYSRNPDHIRKRNVPAPNNEVVSKHITNLLSPIVYEQQAYYRNLGIRERRKSKIWRNRTKMVNSRK